MMNDKILSILCNIRPDIDFGKAQKFITDEILDSFDIVALLDEIMKQFLIEIDVDDITVEHFDSIDDICQLIKEKQNTRDC